MLTVMEIAGLPVPLAGQGLHVKQLAVLLQNIAYRLCTHCLHKLDSYLAHQAIFLHVH